MKLDAAATAQPVWTSSMFLVVLWIAMLLLALRFLSPCFCKMCCVGILTALDLGCMWLQYFVPALMHQLWHGLAYYAPRGLQHLVALLSELG